MKVYTKGIKALVAILIPFLITCAYALLSTPIQLKIGSKTYQIVYIKNLEKSAVKANIYTNCSFVIPQITNLTLQPGESYPVPVEIIGTKVGHFLCTVFAKESYTLNNKTYYTYYNVSIPITVYSVPKIYKYTVAVPPGYAIDVAGRIFSVYYKSGCLSVNGICLTTPLNITINNITITVTRSDGSAVFTITSPSPITYNILKIATTSTNKTQQQPLLLYILPKETSVRLEAGTKQASYVFFIYNPTNYKAIILNTFVSGDEFTYANGVSEPVTKVELGTSNYIIYPQDSVPMVVKLSTTYLKPGTYNVIITVMYKINKQIRYSSTVLTVYVFEQQYNITSYIPNKAKYGSTIHIKVYGMPPFAQVHINTSCLSCTGSSGDYVCKVLCKHPFTVSLYVTAFGKTLYSITKTIYVNYTRPKMYLKILGKIEPGSTITIQAYCKGTLVPAKIYVNGKLESTLTLKPGTYNIVAYYDDCQPASEVITVPYKKLRVILPPRILPYRPIRIIVLDASTGKPVNATIYYDGKITNGTIIPTLGTHTIKVVAQYYKPVVLTIHVSVPYYQINITRYVEFGNNITGTSPIPIWWKVYYNETNKTILVYKSFGKILNFDPKRPGTYIVDAAGENYTVLVYYPRSYINPFPIIVAAFILLIILSICFLIRKKPKPKPSREVTVVPPAQEVQLPSYPAEYLGKEEGEEKEQKEQQ